MSAASAISAAAVGGAALPAGMRIAADRITADGTTEIGIPGYMPWRRLARLPAAPSLPQPRRLPPASSATVPSIRQAELISATTVNVMSAGCDAHRANVVGPLLTSRSGRSAILSE